MRDQVAQHPEGFGSQAHGLGTTPQLLGAPVEVIRAKVPDTCLCHGMRSLLASVLPEAILKRVPKSSKDLRQILRGSHLHLKQGNKARRIVIADGEQTLASRNSRQEAPDGLRAQESPPAAPSSLARDGL